MIGVFIIIFIIVLRVKELYWEGEKREKCKTITVIALRTVTARIIDIKAKLTIIIRANLIWWRKWTSI